MAECDHKEVRSTHHCPTGVHVGVCVRCLTVVHVCSGENAEGLPKFGLPAPGDATGYVRALQDLHRAVGRRLAGDAGEDEVREAFEFVDPERVQLEALREHGPGTTGTATVDGVKARLEEIRGCGKDFEALHSKEDALFVDVLTAIADGRCPDPAGVAKEALKSKEISSKRPCA